MPAFFPLFMLVLKVLSVKPVPSVALQKANLNPPLYTFVQSMAPCQPETSIPLASSPVPTFDGIHGPCWIPEEPGSVTGMKSFIIFESWVISAV